MRVTGPSIPGFIRSLIVGNTDMYYNLYPRDVLVE